MTRRPLPESLCVRPAARSAPIEVAAPVVRGSPAYWRISVALFAAGFATFSLLYCVQPLLPMFADEFGIGAAQSSLALSVSTGSLALSIFVVGAFSDRFRRRHLMFVSIALAAAFNLLAAALPTWNGILAARALEGLALGGVPAVAMAYLAEEIHPNALGLAMGVYVGGTAFGGMVGRVGMSVMSELFSWRSAMLTIGAIDLAVAVLFAALLPASRRFVARSTLNFVEQAALWRRHLADNRMRMLFAVGCLIMGVFVSVYNYAAFRLMAPPFALSAAQTGLIFGAYVFGIVSSSSAGALADRVGRGPVLLCGTLLTAAGLACSLAGELALVIVGIVTLTIGFFVTHAVASGWVGHCARVGRSHASALYLLAYYLGSSILGSASGWCWQTAGWTGVASFCAVLLTLCIIIAILLHRLSER
ncbi:MFS transporter [Trinickia caryophylli]|uniref:MFS transporter, YNFM family, putative membrane transport protein n=1 Tax=Trinickia caryophylli TaxID=28094 RepID=A0A1X7HAJ9_TRICW|nr:MFS transporter [Trinickia caryophylli]PMS08710.1 MFS transporter [Trinickia caryophylli]TRX18286.1 MFS transporter [Trinickia caryophylli]WQE10928.1 MFS transporter [Trinickia caryophylli]SMF82845.1 MFS transporter, YNFM family, putative membrane transport protein [Trinickia caryophylli]GLU35870.1 MFS transporter [Trinickia caryophylli]